MVVSQPLASFILAVYVPAPMFVKGLAFTFPGIQLTVYVPEPPDIAKEILASLAPHVEGGVIVGVTVNWLDTPMVNVCVSEQAF